ncbi:hypothetical protein EVAR_92806_1 [Eumeta japonica]|uniref:Uncharacterized protein n=1 Tax=Eumeta variegata TaxID=151549 RepID=A0A4C2A4G9_EUMVA|nr:hypothetical protein EVAR_92806_1 [Eumeta japonica]
MWCSRSHINDSSRRVKCTGLEAANRVGGRIKNRAEAGRIHGEHPSLVYDLAVQNNVPIRKQYLDMSIHRSDGTEVNKNTSEELINYCFHLMESPPKDHKPLGKYITRK